MTFLEEIEAFLAETQTSATAFGKAALNDPPFVADLREGRNVTLATVEKCRAFIRSAREAQPA